MKLSVRNLLIGLVIVIVLAVVLLRGDQLVELVETMKKGAAIPLIAALCTQLGKYFAQSFAYSFAFEAVDERMDPRSTLPLVFGTFFMNTIAPSLNLAGTTLVVDDARRRGIAPGRATSAALLMQITVDSGFATIMLIGFAILALTVGLSPLWFLLGLLVIALVSVMVLILVLGRKRPALVLRALRPVERLVDRVRARFKKAPLDPWVERAVGSFSDAAGLIAHNPKATAKTFGCSIVASLCELACFSLVGLGFGVTVPESLICGYVVATLFAMISITPQGVGVVEAAVVVAFTSFGVSGAAGLSIALVYRGIVFWMPFLIGAILIQTTKTFKHEAKKTVRASGKRDRMSVAERQAKRLDEARAQDARPAAPSDVRSARPDEPAPAPRAAAPQRAGSAQDGPPAGPPADPPARAGRGSAPRTPRKPEEPLGR
ncbi:lysylphosphatidylglycerol synthase transmembrane domain-containing protein [Gordonibacter sp. 28C]|uniref:lysylphosphatidylglycerol synthase transmembrane domain-containing protein n=1 Tax=Gordonibacter sp. 28C TaxID=2078569 RepID=UPI001F5427D2|nr:lysylphosphatidylglycerol synthase transmembrane domain-containing protein [Gordonibacter sp. 28C]